MLPVASDLRDQDFFLINIFEGSDLQNGVGDLRNGGATSKMGLTSTEVGGRPATSLSHPIAIKITPYMPPPLWGGPGGPMGAPGGTCHQTGARTPRGGDAAPRQGDAAPELNNDQGSY